MNILHISKNEISGGAARATNRIHSALLEKEVESKMLVLNKESDSESIVKVRRRFFVGFFFDKVDSILKRALSIKKLGFFSSGLLGVGNIRRYKEYKDADIICLYWVSGGFLSVFEIAKILKSGKPIVWRLSDMWPFTGGLHYSTKSKEQSFSFRFKIFNIFMLFLKKVLWKSDRLTVVCPSEWIKKEAMESQVFKGARFLYIPTGVDVEKFSPLDRYDSCLKFSLPFDKELILFGAVNSFDDFRKGGDLLVKALILLAKGKSKKKLPDIVVFGSSTIPYELFSLYNCHLLGNISSDIDLAYMYSACDVFIAPSREENLANTVLESLACSTPCVAFNVGGMPDMIVHEVNGYLVEPFNVYSLVEGINYILDRNRIDKLTNDIVVLDKCFWQNNSIDEYFRLYREIS